MRLESMNAKPECVRVAFQPLSFLASQHPGLLALSTSADQYTRQYYCGKNYIGIT
jgi:hypothetical protein